MRPDMVRHRVMLKWAPCPVEKLTMNPIPIVVEKTHESGLILRALGKLVPPAAEDVGNLPQQIRCTRPCHVEQGYVPQKITLC